MASFSAYIITECNLYYMWQISMVCHVPIIISLWLSTRPIRLIDLVRQKSHLQNFSSMEHSYTVLSGNGLVVQSFTITQV
jgi:hypothetical protein